MTDRGELFGFGTPAVRADVDADLAAHRHGPAAFARAVAAAPRDLLLARYAALCARINHEQATRHRDAWHGFAVAEATDEAHQVRSGGNR